MRSHEGFMFFASSSWCRGLVCSVSVAFPGLVTGTEIQGSVLTSSDRYCDSDSNGSYWKSGQ